ncbi:RNA polymerase sigma factor [Synoicihabitans lomoniglobus]|uniref:Sigma-70 family RNA polymerase sigma factor n=1 Tax=Synoicihabitans lomoniglobus TaxID=2909285 RepID=A0AAE9ZRZ7_9BACT|nr:sigma-70 family RNA polymerase sigma factor [Opitutaceae bacterium LMO-M01]WED64155.1 sigma-70 family RNA polymerase sigma factor [Opitutaceae bacterium LMO-M01]
MDEGIGALTRAMGRLEEDAYRRFFHEYFPRLRAYAHRLTQGNTILADDVTQDTFLRVVRHIRPINSSEELWCWLVLLSRCAFLDAVRKERRYLSLLHNYEIDAEIQSSPSRNTIEGHEALSAALRRLHQRERQMLLAKYRDDETNHSIARSHGLSPKAVESRLSRIRAKLKTILPSSIPPPR